MTPAPMSPEEVAARDELLTVQKGKRVRVVKGRKVPRGVEGMVFWIGDGNYGPRIGITDDQGTAHWLSMSNVVVLLDGVAPQSDPAEGWVSYLKKARAEESAKLAHVPVKGAMVTIKESGVTGKVFWVKGERLGVRVGSDRSEVAWVNADDLLPTQPPPPVIPVTQPPATQSSEAEVLEQFASMHDDGALSEDAPVFLSVIPLEKKIRAMPHPYGLLTYLQRQNGVWEGRDASDNIILRLTEAGARKLIADFALT